MKLFINEIPVQFINVKKLTKKTNFDVILKKDDKIISEKLVGNILIKQANDKHFDKVFKLLYKKQKIHSPEKCPYSVFEKLTSITFEIKHKRYYKKFLKDWFTVVKAAGGLIRKDKKIGSKSKNVNFKSKILMIYRLGKWDLPKGKLHKNERSKKCAVREVEEECNIKVELNSKLCTTWHVYTKNNKKVLKRTKWYLMRCLDDSKMTPQIEEDIVDVKWMDKGEVKKALTNSYGSIKEVFRKYSSI